MNVNKSRKKREKKARELLYSSLDSHLTDEEERILKEGIRDSADLRKEREEILEQRQALSEGAALSFRPLFAERVMSRIEPAKRANGLEVFYETLKASFRRCVIAGAIIMIALVSYNATKGDSISSEEIFYASEVTVEEIVDLPLF